MWYENDGGGAFAAQRVIAKGRTQNSAYPADLDGDGDVDVLASGTWEGVAWYENDGGGTFSASKLIEEHLHPDTAFGEDLDGDGDADVVVAASSEVVWYENDRARFQARPKISASSYFSASLDTAEHRSGR